MKILIIFTINYAKINKINIVIKHGSSLWFGISIEAFYV